MKNISNGIIEKLKKKINFKVQVLNPNIWCGVDGSTIYTVMKNYITVDNNETKDTLKYKITIEEYNELVKCFKNSSLDTNKLNSTKQNKKNRIYNIVNEFTDFLYQTHPDLYSTISPDTIKDVVDEIIDVLLED